MTNVLVTGGLGYIGSHTVVELLNHKYKVIIVDNLSNSSKIVLGRIRIITGKSPIFYALDICDKLSLKKVFIDHTIDAVIHFAAFKSVSESVSNPLTYYSNNICGSLVLLELMKDYNVKKIVFSSSATVYSTHNIMPVNETANLSAITPYGRTKLVIEEILDDIHRSDRTWNIAILRYFNPIGAHFSGLIGEHPNGVSNNLMPYINQVAVGKLSFLKVFGNDYDTIDGTGVRDYIHVVDLALGHLNSLEYFENHPNEIITLNLGTGSGHSVLEVVKAFELTSGIKIKYEFLPRRSGDIPICFANNQRAKTVLNWHPQYNLLEMCRDSWNWQSKNPNGYTL